MSPRIKKREAVLNKVQDYLTYEYKPVQSIAQEMESELHSQQSLNVKSLGNLLRPLVRLGIIEKASFKVDGYSRQICYRLCGDGGNQEERQDT